MRNPFTPGVGGVLSADIAVPEHERELAFYAQILSTGSSPLWREDLTNNRGLPVIGLAARTPDYEILPLQWMPHFQVSDVAASVRRALDRGGSELVHGRDESGRSEWAVLMDPTGAAFGLVPVVGPESELPARPELIGRIVWLTLTASDPSAASEFYEEVVGWSSVSTPGGQLEMRCPSGVGAAEIRQGDGSDMRIPHVWIISLPVAGFEESLRRARDLGGEVVGSWADSSDTIIRDPVGVHLALRASE